MYINNLHVKCFKLILGKAPNKAACVYYNSVDNPFYILVTINIK